MSLRSGPAFWVSSGFSASRCWKNTRVVLLRGEKIFPLDETRQWEIRPQVRQGARVRGGEVLFEVDETFLVRHRVMLPPGLEGELEYLAPAGMRGIRDPVWRIRDARGVQHEGGLFHWWPARKGRLQRKRPVDRPLLTGLRIIDTFFPISKVVSRPSRRLRDGKTMTQHALAKWSDADAIVYIGCGERGNERPMC